MAQLYDKEVAALFGGPDACDPQSVAVFWNNLAASLVTAGKRHQFSDGNEYDPVECINRSLALRPDYDRAWQNLAAVGGGDHGVEKCLASCLEGWDTSRNSADRAPVLLQLGHLLATSGRSDEVSDRRHSAKQCLEQAAELVERGDDESTRRLAGQAWYNIGLLGGTEELKPEQCYKRAVLKHKGLHQAWYCLSKLSFPHDRQATRDHLSSCLDSSQDFEPAWRALGHVLMTDPQDSVARFQNKDVRAHDCFANALRLDKDVGESWLNLGNCLSAGHEVETAFGKFSKVECYDRAIKATRLAPRELVGKAWFNLASIRMQEDDRHGKGAPLDRASKGMPDWMKCFELALEHDGKGLDGQVWQAWNNIGYGLFGKKGERKTALVNGDTVDAGNCFQRAVACLEMGQQRDSPQVTGAEAYNNLGVAGGEDGFDAEACFKRAVEIAEGAVRAVKERARSASHETPANATLAAALNNLGSIALKRERWSEARGYLERTSALAPLSNGHEAKRLSNIGVCHARESNAGAARQHFTRALHLDKDCAVASRGLSLTEMDRDLSMDPAALEKLIQSESYPLTVSAAWNNLGVHAINNGHASQLGSAPQCFKNALDVCGRKPRQRSKSSSSSSSSSSSKSESKLRAQSPRAQSPNPPKQGTKLALEEVRFSSAPAEFGVPGTVFSLQMKGYSTPAVQLSSDLAHLDFRSQARPVRIPDATRVAVELVMQQRGGSPVVIGEARVDLTSKGLARIETPISVTRDFMGQAKPVLHYSTQAS